MANFEIPAWPAILFYCAWLCFAFSGALAWLWYMEG